MSTGDNSEIHALAQFFSVRSGCDGIVLLTDDYKSAIEHYPDTAMILLLQTTQSRLSIEEINALPANVAVLPLKKASEGLLKNKVFVCINYLERKRYFYGSYGHGAIRRVAQNAVLSIWSVKRSGSWDVRRLKKMLRSNRSALVGKHAKDRLLAIDGRLSDVYRRRYTLLPVLAIVSQFNEIDIIESVISHLLSQGVDVHVIDNWSTDGSYEAVAEIARLQPKRVSVERFPLQDSHHYEWSKILKRVTDVARERPQYKWIISNDSDEIRWSPWPGVSLQKAISFIDGMAFNIVDYTVFNFSPTKDGFKRGTEPADFFRYGDFGREGWHFMQQKTWKNHPDADIVSTGGHIVNLPDNKIFPLKFFLGHYPLRSNQQAAKKIFHDRKPRFLDQERKKGWHSHYDRAPEKKSYIRTNTGLIRTNKGWLPKGHLLECISGIGIRLNKI